MSVKVAGGVKEDGIVVGNTFDKYGSTNPIVRWMMQGFDDALATLVRQVAPASIHEVGCGEGYWVLRWSADGMAARGCDFSAHCVELARENAATQGVRGDLFAVRSIYDLEAPRDSADLVVCCEVLEHLEEPRRGLEALRRVANGHLVVSVPNEPLWRLLNLARLKYVGALGNTPGHLQHWSRSSFVQLVGEYFDVLEVRTPLPWVMLLCRARP